MPGTRKLGRTSDHRTAMLRAMVTYLLENGRIASMGEGETPDCESVIDGEGGVLTPGLIDIHSHIGLYEDGLGFEGADGRDDLTFQ